ncbi:sugar kinase [Rivibacter subsaxonicus]|uniref:2-dehydro-3-deoxygluconokinase n=1 Tax=Rivibacter subsaxonicus TaxID=457575 RepID=A0A4Q7V5X6_9BURK|nr:sugar kinase [Rivibacter subsaxonicus]RZT91956.1 2-keto-3-deoxygluconate kinase [Rivibacter subsaxonicus]
MATPLNVALLGECMLELQGQAFGAMHQGFGGDTLNTAVYLARCADASALRCYYATALGDDALSSGLLSRWAAEGLDLSLVRRIPGRLPGLYMIELDECGERSFSFWRDSSAAKAYFDVELSPLECDPGQWDALYLSGTSLAILPASGRQRVFALMRTLRERGATVVFDNNFRARLWPDRAEARDCFEQALALASLALVTVDDHQLLLGVNSRDEALAHARELTAPELVIKRGAESTLVRSSGAGWLEVPTVPVATVVDTTAAGDSFAAGYLCRRLAGASAQQAALFGNQLAARVIQHHGAVIPRAAMADLAA